MVDIKLASIMPLSPRLLSRSGFDPALLLLCLLY